MFSTSGDILNIIIAVCVVALTVFLCLALYYLISSVRKTHKVINLIEKGVSQAESVITMAKDKIKSSSSYFMILGELAKRAMDYFIDKKRDNDEEKKTKKKK